MKTLAIFFCSGVILCSGCGTDSIPGMVLSEKDKQKTQLETREMQTRTYQTQDKKLVMKAMLNVLQDDDYIIEQVNLDLGFFNAQKELNAERGKAHAIYKNQIIDVTANISEYGEETRVRVNFRVKVMNGIGVVVIVRQVDDPEYYQKFFSKVDKGIFIEKEKI
ncbi:hypothetical protein ACFL3G_13290 [Planctomycetota bacterium]